MCVERKEEEDADQCVVFQCNDRFVSFRVFFFLSVNLALLDCESTDFLFLFFDSFSFFSCCFFLRLSTSYMSMLEGLASLREATIKIASKRNN
mmetsp:Transcript_34090/g.81982  ORF Transcript_34090/g.81982 Transcript_34090/m.81982 type:complete len:93 (+) Transcript_34090:2463-2741(+)